MKDKICIIMADGKAKRMSGLNKKKQLIEVDGEPIICRTIKQLRALGIEPVIATHFEDFDFLDIQHIIPENNNHEINKFNANKKYYKDYEPNDSKAVVDYIKTHDTGEILKKAALWGEDLSFMTEIVNESLAEINKDGIREAVKWSMS